MVTPIRTMTINQIVERKDDLLMSDEDIKELARNERDKAIDKFTENIINHNNYIFDDAFGYVIPFSDVVKIADQMKGGVT